MTSFLFCIFPHHIQFSLYLRVTVRMLNTTFNNISAISWRLISLVEETWVPGENHRPAASHWQTLCCIEYTSPWAGFKLTTLVVKCTDWTGSCKSTMWSWPRHHFHLEIKKSLAIWTVLLPMFYLLLKQLCWLVSRQKHKI